MSGSKPKQRKLDSFLVSKPASSENVNRKFKLNLAIELRMAARRIETRNETMFSIASEDPVQTAASVASITAHDPIGTPRTASANESTIVGVATTSATMTTSAEMTNINIQLELSDCEHFCCFIYN